MEAPQEQLTDREIGIIERLLIHSDERGCGLSDWDVADLSFEAWVRDLEAVVGAVGLKRSPLFAMSQACAVAVAYAARHPERVSRMILHGGYARGWLKRDPSEEQIEEENLMVGQMRISLSPEDAVRLEREMHQVDIRHLAPRVRAPALVTHSRGDEGVPFEAGRLLASLIPGAQFVPLESKNHLVTRQEPAWLKLVDAMRGFLRAEDA